MSKFHLEIVTPERLFFEGDVERVIVKGREGDLAILKDHSPLATPLRISKVRILKDGEERIASAVRGYITVIDNKVTIVTDAAEWPEEIDTDRAEAAARRAREKLERARSKKEQQVDLLAAEAALKRALTRLDVAGRR